MGKIGKGSRVEIVSGEHEGVVGQVFWWGKSKFDDGMRAGVKGDDGETYWADAEDLAEEGTTESETDEPKVTSKDPAPQIPVPFVAAHPRDGSFSVDDLESNTVESGEYVDGLRHGTWRKFSSDGQHLQETEWQRGRRHGAFREWSPSGELITEGRYANHLPAGEWCHYHENGELKESFAYDDEGKRHGPYVWNLDDGTPRARGGFWHERRHGDWEWLHGDEYERSIRGYHRGAKHGEEARWYTDGQLEYRRTHSYGSKHGEEKRFHPDGSPAFEGTWQYGYGVGTHRAWDESGEETVTQFVDGLPAETDEETDELTVGFDAEKAAKKVQKADDSYAKTCALDEFVDYSHRAAAIFHMWKSGVYDAPQDPKIWEALGNAAGLFSGEDLVEFLEGVTTEDVNGAHLPYWSRSLDRLVMDVYARDPEPLDAARESLPEKVQKGVALVRARFGEDVGDALHGELDALVHKHAHDYGIADRIDWPTDGWIEQVPLFDDFKKEPTDTFMAFIELFGGYDAWADGLEKEAVAELDDGSDIRFEIYRPVVERANQDLLLRLCKSISLSGMTQDFLHDALLQWRDDDGETLTRLALAMDDTGLRKWPLTSIAVLKLHEEGAEVPDELVEAFALGEESPTYSSRWISDAIGAIPDEFDADPDYVADALKLEPRTAVPRVTMVHDALATLSEDQVRSIIDRHLTAKYGKLGVVSYLYFVDDPELWEQVIELVEEHDNPHPRYTWGFGNLGSKVLPLLEAALERSDGELEYTWRQALVVALTRAALDGEEIEPKYDRHIHFDLMHPKTAYNYHNIQPYIERLVYLLPTERAEPILEAALDGEQWARALRAVSSHPTKSLLTRAFQVVLEKESTMESGEMRAFGTMLKGLPNPVEWVRWVLETGGGAGCKSALSDAVGWKTFEALEEELANPVKELDHIDKVVNLAEEVGEGEPIYLLRRLDEQKHDDLNVIGGPAPGVDAERWPTYEDQPMAHLYTLDLETMPTLGARYDARAISVFCHSPGFNEAWEPGTPQSAVIFTTEKQLADAGAPPDGVDEKPEAWFEVVSVDVDLSHDKLRGEVYRAGARVMGPAMWLQEEAYWGDFLMQFDEQFVYMNLGDMGIMYVFADTAFWQCH